MYNTDMKCLYIIAGANGGGQIVLVAEYDKDIKQQVYSDPLYADFIKDYE